MAGCIRDAASFRIRRARSFKGRNGSFLEKKNQKTFGPAGFGVDGAKARNEKSFFASFFTKKEALAFFPR
jgi:hypothetical protein